MPEIRVQRETPDGDIQLAVRDEDLGWFVIDNNENLWSDALPKFSLEYRDETSWASPEFGGQGLESDDSEGVD